MLIKRVKSEAGQFSSDYLLLGRGGLRGIAGLLNFALTSKNKCTTMVRNSIAHSLMVKARIMDNIFYSKLGRF